MNVSWCLRKSKVPRSSGGLIGGLDSSGRGERLRITGSFSASGSRMSMACFVSEVVLSPVSVLEGASVDAAERPDGLFGR